MPGEAAAGAARGHGALLLPGRAHRSGGAAHRRPAQHRKDPHVLRADAHGRTAERGRRRSRLAEMTRPGGASTRLARTRVLNAFARIGFPRHRANRRTTTETLPCLT